MKWAGWSSKGGSEVLGKYLLDIESRRYDDVSDSMHPSGGRDGNQFGPMENQSLRFVSQRDLEIMLSQLLNQIHNTRMILRSY